MGSIPGSGRFLGEGMATHSSIPAEIPVERGAWPTIVHGFTRVRYNSATQQPPPQHPNYVHPCLLISN